MGGWGVQLTSTASSTSQTEKSAPFSVRTRFTSAANQGLLGSMIFTFGRSAYGMSARTLTVCMTSCGASTGSPVLMARMTSRPLMTRPKAV